MNEKLEQSSELIRNSIKMGLNLEDIVINLFRQDFSQAIIIKSLSSEGFNLVEVNQVLNTIEIPPHLARSFEDLFFDHVDLE